MTSTIIGVYPGTFDPVTDGHMDIINRATRVVDRLIVAVAKNYDKRPMFSHDERAAMVAEDIANVCNGDSSRIEVKLFNSLLVNFVSSSGASVIIRGLRAVSDFEYEFQMAGMNRRLNPNIETVFLMSSDRHQFISSRFVKEIGCMGGDIGHFVSPNVAECVRLHLADNATGKSD